MQAGAARADDVDVVDVADVKHGAGRRADERQGAFEDAAVGLLDADDVRIDDARHQATQALAPDDVRGAAVRVADHDRWQSRAMDRLARLPDAGHQPRPQTVRLARHAQHRREIGGDVGALALGHVGDRRDAAEHDRQVALEGITALGPARLPHRRGDARPRGRLGALELPLVNDHPAPRQLVTHPREVDRDQRIAEIEKQRGQCVEPNHLL